MSVLSDTKKNICLLVALSQWPDYSRLFRLIRARRGPDTSPVPPIVGIKKLPQKPACLPSAPKIDSITLPIPTTSQTLKPAPKVLATDMQKYMRILQTNHWCSKFQILDWNPNLSLLSAETVLTSYYKISFIKILFTINVNHVPGSICPMAIFLSLHFTAACFPLTLFLSLPHYDTKLHIVVIVVFLCSPRFKKKLFPISSFRIYAIKTHFTTHLY